MVYFDVFKKLILDMNVVAIRGTKLNQYMLCLKAN